MVTKFQDNKHMVLSLSMFETLWESEVEKHQTLYSVLL